VNGKDCDRIIESMTTNKDGYIDLKYLQMKINKIEMEEEPIV
jgi:hypothetical protein